MGRYHSDTLAIEVGHVVSRASVTKVFGLGNRKA